ncbi:MAG: rhodanese-like domain-containing protein [Ardenticatenaceae bacterium]
MPRKEAGEPYYRISIEEAADLYGDDDALFIDVRRPDEYQAGHIKDAKYIIVDDILGRIDELPQDKKLLFICAAGVRSGLACEMAAAMGYDSENLFNIEAGTQAWIDAGKPTSYGNEP